MYNYLDFEKPVADLEGKIIELRKLAENGEAVDVAEEIDRLEKRSREALRDVYKALTPWQRCRWPGIPTGRTVLPISRA